MNSVTCGYPACSETAIMEISWIVREREHNERSLPSWNTVGYIHQYCEYHSARMRASINGESISTMVYHRPL